MKTHWWLIDIGLGDGLVPSRSELLSDLLLHGQYIALKIIYV